MSESSKLQDEKFVRLLSQHERVIRAFLRSLLPSMEDVDQVMPEVALIAWKKFDQLLDHDAFPRWACVIARYEVMTYRRNKARDRMVLSPELINKLADEADEEIGQRSQQLHTLEECLNKLSDERRALILACYSPHTSMRQIAIESKRSENGLYQLIRRIRLELQACMEKHAHQDLQA